MFGLGWKIAAGFGFISVLMGAISYFGYEYLTAQNEILRQNVQQYEQVNKQLKRNNQIMQQNFESMQQRQNELTQQFNEIEQNTSQLQRLFSEHDFGNLVSEKPGLIEPRVNKGTSDVLMNLEEITDPSTYQTQMEQGNENNDDEKSN